MNTEKSTITFGSILMMVLVILVLPFLPMLISWRWNWWEAWLYAIGSIISFVISRYLASRKNPGLVAERARQTRHADAQSWDKVLAPLTGLGGTLILITVGLDALLGWTAPFGVLIRLAGIVLFLAGHFLGGYALYENGFFSGMVRLQEDRGHHVISSGPYMWVRHPGYTGALLTYLGTPLMLNSWWAFLPAIFMFAVVITRTALEDRFLQENLAGYKEFTSQTRYRLFPGIW